MLTILIFIIILAFTILFYGEKVTSKYFIFLTLVPTLTFAYFLSYVPKIQLENTIDLAYSWIPTLGIDLNFRIDGLSLLFSLLISGIGALIFAYTSYYLKENTNIHRFYAYLMLFMVSMLGLVLSDNFISIYIFWEFTSVVSFFLIGFNQEREESRKGALLSFAITGLGGFFLLSGFLILGHIANTYSIRELFSLVELIKNHSLFPLALIFIFLGAFTKSAQFPFYFWLPGAMQAPTPVSAYLHSATMVKAGIYILTRLFPILGGGLLWSNTLMIVGSITMLYAGFHSIFKKDLKLILAYSTIAALGMMMFLLGIGTEHAIYAVITFILVHALYKATLFLVVGIIDHATHTREISNLSGLKHKLPIVFWASLIAAFSASGIILTFGFIAKDLIYETTLQLPSHAKLWTIIVIVTNVLIATSSLMAGIRPFIGKLPKQFQEIKKPNILLWLPIGILSFLSLLYGILPSIIDKEILVYAFNSTYRQPTTMYLKVWHGFNFVLLLSILTVFIAFVLFFIKKPLYKMTLFIERLESISPKHIATISGKKIEKFAFLYTRFFQNGYLRNYVRVIILFITVLVGYRLLTAVPLRINTNDLSPISFYEVTIIIMMLISIGFTILTKTRLTAITSLGVMGFCICLIYVFYGAPDIAMTQFTIDTLTVVLFVLVLFKLPAFLPSTNKFTLVRDAVVSIAFGVLISIITLQALLYPAVKQTSQFFANNVYLLAKGRNVVNVILVDFRGADTMIETIVLSIAAIGVYNLLTYKTESSERE